MSKSLQVDFPAPIKFGPRMTRWQLSKLEAFEARVCGERAPAPRAPEEELYLSSKQVARRYDASVPTVWRWVAESKQAEGA